MTQIGVTLEPLEFSVKQGSAGSQLFTTTWTGVSDFNGWTCVIEFESPYDNRVVIRFTPTVTGDSGANTLSFTMAFDTDTTETLPPGVYTGDVCMTAPTTGLRFYPADILLSIEESIAP